MEFVKKKVNADVRGPAAHMVPDASLLGMFS
jgi:hypothetical protein